MTYKCSLCSCRSNHLVLDHTDTLKKIENQDDLNLTYIYIIYFIYKIERIKVMFLVDFITVSGT